MLIVKGKTQRSLHAFNTREAPQDIVWTFQNNGCTTDDIVQQQFIQVFLRNNDGLRERPQLLIIDSHTSHESLAIIEREFEKGTRTLPPHCAHYLQPLDGLLFGPLRCAYNEACSTVMQDHPLSLVNKWTFPIFFKETWLNVIFPSSMIVSSFHSCGIVSLNRNTIPSIAYAPSKPIDVSIVNATCSSGIGASVVPASSQQ